MERLPEQFAAVPFDGETLMSPDKASISTGLIILRHRRFLIRALQAWIRFIRSGKKKGENPL
jgi:hypothetical protein